MRNLMNLLLIFTALAITTGVFAQSIGIKAGLNLSTMLVKDDDDTYSNDFILNPGFHAGVVGEIPFGDVFAVEPGLFLTTKGYKIDEKILDMTIKGNINPMYIELPVNGKFSFDLGGVRIYLAAGPYVGYGIGGKYKTEMTNESGNKETEEQDIQWGSDEAKDDFKNLDYGVTAGAGIEISGMTVGFSYGYGLANISPYTHHGYIVNNRVMGISAGYKFGF